MEWRAHRRQNLPNAWAETKLLDGYPGREVTLATRKGDKCYVAGITAEQRREKTKMLKFDFLPGGRKYKPTLIADGKHDKDFSTQYIVADKNSSV